jgi:hypothetical protein
LRGVKAITAELDELLLLPVLHLFLNTRFFLSLSLSLSLLALSVFASDADPSPAPVPVESVDEAEDADGDLLDESVVGAFLLGNFILGINPDAVFGEGPVAALGVASDAESFLPNAFANEAGIAVAGGTVGVVGVSITNLGPSIASSGSSVSPSPSASLPSSSSGSYSSAEDNPPSSPYDINCSSSSGWDRIVPKPLVGGALTQDARPFPSLFRNSFNTSSKSNKLAVLGGATNPSLTHTLPATVVFARADSSTSERGCGGIIILPKSRREKTETCLIIRIVPSQRAREPTSNSYPNLT